MTAWFPCYCVLILLNARSKWPKEVTSWEVPCANQAEIHGTVLVCITLWLQGEVWWWFSLIKQGFSLDGPDGLICTFLGRGEYNRYSVGCRDSLPLRVGYVLINPLCVKNINQNSSVFTSPTDHPRLAPLWRCGSLGAATARHCKSLAWFEVWFLLNVCCLHLTVKSKNRDVEPM